MSWSLEGHRERRELIFFEGRTLTSRLICTANLWNRYCLFFFFTDDETQSNYIIYENSQALIIEDNADSTLPEEEITAVQSTK